MRPFVRSATVVVLAVLVTSCGSGRGVAERTIFSFVDAVQSEDLGTLQCLLAGASGSIDDPAAESEPRRLEFDAWARGRYAAYLEGRDAGGVELGDDGVVLTKAFALGKGAFYRVSRVRREDDALIVDTEVRFAYGDIDISGLPPGTVFYACGTPVGRIEAVKIPYGRGTEEAELLDTIDVRWTLVRSPATPTCPERWTVATAEPLASTATTREIVWEF